MTATRLTGAELDGLPACVADTAVARIAVVRASLPHCEDPRVLTALARAVPTHLARLTPEVALALGELALHLAPYGVRPVEDLAELAPRVRVVWLRVALVADPAAAVRAADERALLDATHGWSLEALPTALPLFDHLARASDPRLQLLVVNKLPEAVQQLLLTGEQAAAYLASLAERSAHPEVRARALQQSSRFWLLGLSLQARRRHERALATALLDEDDAVAASAVDAAAELGARPLLLDALADPALPEARAAHLLDALGPVAEAADVELVLGLAARDALRFGPPARRFLLAAHRHGVFLREEHLEAALALFDQHAAWTAEELVRVTHLARKALPPLLAQLPAGDLRWIRRAAILAASRGAAAAQVLSQALAALEGAPAEVDPRVPIALLEAAGASAEAIDEEALLAWLERFPEVVIPLLRVKGSAASAARLRELVLEPKTLPAVRRQALEVLWALARDRRGLLAELAARLGPEELDLYDRRFVSSRDSAIAEALLAAGRDQEERAPLSQLEVYCEAGEPRFMPEVTRLFRQLVRHCVQQALAGDFTIKRLQLPLLEQHIFRYGRHLLKDGRPVRRWVMPGPETGRDLLLLLIVDWLAERPEPPICVALLEMAKDHGPDGAYLRALEPLWRKGDANVRRAALELLAAAPVGAHGLELSLGRLVAESADPRLLVPALVAARELRAGWAEPLVRAALERPEMAVKKEAAEALAELATGASVPALVGWLARHDNDSFRASLLRALQRAAGAAWIAVVLEAIERQRGEPAEARSRELLWQTLSTRLPLAVVLRLARSPAPEHVALVAACLDGRVAVADASRAQIAAALHRAQLREVEPVRDPAERLRLEGFSPALATQLLDELTAERPEDPAAAAARPTLEVVRGQLASWLGWLAEAERPPPLGLRLALDATALAAGEPLIARALELAERWHAQLEPAAAMAFLERVLTAPTTSSALRVRGAALLRALASSPKLGGQRRYRLLAAVGAVRTPADLLRALDDARQGASYARDSEELLVAALQLPARKAREPEALTALREGCASWFRAEDAARRAWLERALAERPLDVPRVEELSARAPTRTSWRFPGAGERASLVERLHHRDPNERTRAARALLAWPDAWPDPSDPTRAGAMCAPLLEAYLSEALSGEALGDDGRRALALGLTAWPEERGRRAQRLVRLIPHLAPWQVRAFAPGWIARWEAGDAEASELLVALGPDRLLRYALERARAGSYALTALLRPSRSSAMAELLELLAAAAPREAARLTAREEAAPGQDAGGPVDPLEGKGVRELLELLAAKKVEQGLAVRAVHALARFGEPAVAPLSKLALDRRPQVRSAALRALRTVATREHTLAVTAEVLAQESRRDVAQQLMASLAHGRYEPALPSLLGRVLDRDPRVREWAIKALRAWGTDALPALHREARRARPDHRRAFEAVIRQLEGEPHERSR